jgi:hypothetical protein
MLPFAAAEWSMSDRLLTLESRQVSGLLFPCVRVPTSDPSRRF